MMYGLLVNRLYLEEILDGRKSSDIRSYSTSHRGKIALLENKTLRVYGTVEIESVTSATYRELREWQSSIKYQIPEDPLGDRKKYYRYNMRNPVRFAKPLVMETHPVNNVWVYIEDSKMRRAMVQPSLLDFS